MNWLAGVFVDNTPDPSSAASEAHERWLNLNPDTQPDAKSEAHERWLKALERLGR